MDFDSYSALLFSRRDRVLTIALNRPHRMNAVDGVLHRELSRVFYDAARDDTSMCEEVAPQDTDLGCQLVCLAEKRVDLGRSLCRN